MINFENFKKAVDLIIEKQDYEDKLYDLKIDMLDTPVFNDFGLLSDLFFETHFNENGVDAINWWLYEKNLSISGNPLEMYDENDNIIPTTTIEDLWNVVKDDRI